MQTNNDVKNPAEICKAIAVDFKKRELTYLMAGEMLGLSKQSVSNQISGKKTFSFKSAQRYDETFGYDVRFLLFGEGSLYEDIKPEG
jgi:predicted transcriptional regulator